MKKSRLPWMVSFYLFFTSCARKRNSMLNNHCRLLILALTLGVSLFILPSISSASIVIVSNGSQVYANTSATVLTTTTDTDFQSVAFTGDTTIPGTFGDTVVAHAEATGYMPPTVYSYADASASLQATVNEVNGVVTVTGNGSAQASVYPVYLASGEAAAYARLSLSLELDAPYAYSFFTGPIVSEPQLNGATYISAGLGNPLGAFFSTDTILTGCDFGCPALPAPFEGSFNGILDPGTYGFSVGAVVSPIYVVEPGGRVSFENATLVMTPMSVVPIPAAFWLFGSGLIGLFGVMRRRKTRYGASGHQNNEI